ncbi:MAG: autotransporter beta- protein, partial [Rhizorhabdus sp.]|nr:autotransporter beta- protein [Rhizorhabdus sp.]
TIINSGKIVVDESYTPTDADNDGDLDGPLATGARRTGILTGGGFIGNISNSGTITIEGNDSAGIALGGPLTGTFTSDGTIAVTGDRSVGIGTGDISGAVRIAGSISAQGKDAQGVVIGGNLGGALVVQGTIVATGYRNTTPPSDVTKLDADDLLQGGPALNIAGNVAGGIILAVPPKDSSATDNDEDKDGIDDAKEGSASVTSVGSAAAVQIGAADHAVTVGAVAGNANGHGLVIDGAVAGLGTYAGVNGNGLVIGGLGGTVSIAGGATINGSVQATATGTGGKAIAVRIGSGATVPEIRVAGTVSAATGSTTTSKATAIAIDAGASVGAIRNSGTIRATAGGTDGAATAIVDASGGLKLIENSGTISASGALASSDRNIAIDLHLTNGATVRQTAVAAGVTAPSIKGDVLFGSGNDLFDLADGSMAGTARFGTGVNTLALSGDATFAGQAIFGAGNDAMTLAGTSVFVGTADFGGGADTLVLSGSSHFVGTFANSQGLALSVASGTLDLTNKGAVSLASLSVGAQGVISVNVDAAAHTNTVYQVSGNASFAAGSKVAVRLANVADSEGRYTIVKAGSITGAANLGATALLPFMYKSSIVAGANANEIALDISRKTTGELGLNRSQASAYDAIYKALDKDTKVAGVFLDIADGDRFRRSVRQMLPDHAGGTFETVTQGSRATARLLADPNPQMIGGEGWGGWFQQVAWGTSKNLDETAAYDVSGWGASGGGEVRTGYGAFGVSLAYLNGRDADGGTDNRVLSTQYELAGYWRGRWGPFAANARASAATINFRGTRYFNGVIGSEAVSRTAKGKWNGKLYSAGGGASYELRHGKLTLRPIVAIDYYRLSEDGYSEAGGGKAFSLIVSGRTSDELAASGTVAAGLDFGGEEVEAGWFRAEIEAGRRQLVGGSLGNTTARFDGGTAFTLVPEDRTSGWVARLRGVGGNSQFQLGGEVGAEQQQGRAALSLRVSLQMGL